MRVSPGDMAIITRGRERNLGKLVLVSSFYGDVDYSHIGYGVLPCWNIEAAGSADLDAEGKCGTKGFIPDLALMPIAGIGANETEGIRKAKAQQEFNEALNELAEVFRYMEAKKMAQRLAQKAIKKAARIRRG